ncbi:MAG: bifunctional methylenetetrahydrofolate dehydrogenase/methenyltetrahydrofolate cyclohydrolase FolD [Magnetococcales bacterium]|nr:bifunctional methylenetetrahydrofolate dehydrogenase/methenyltetrahydrofolate cyclohydrolase FolD [Magnetococcales bacterium]MBF0115447.1 bifunctional methylenetetrahydrofolate dehydrogenase/methenyltetrahydrofolate cyclohydrolase FolD [Magnetococcales bacterium]
MGKIIDGKEIAKQLRLQLREEVQSLTAEHGVTPGLAVIVVGENPASHLYVRMKKQACADAGIVSFSHELPQETTEEALLSLIQTLNEHPAVHGILVQMPLPAHIRSQRILEAISPDKDADGFHPRNVGLLAVGAPLFRPCTPWGCMELLHLSGVKPAGQNAVVLGRSNIVGKPVALMLLAEHATVTLCHSQTRALPEIVRQADILISAMGQAELVRGDWLKPGVVVIDVGMNHRASDGKLCGDVAFQEALPKVSAITPVPGGVGPMTITMLLKNTVFSASRFIA